MDVGQKGSTIHPTPHRWHTPVEGSERCNKGQQQWMSTGGSVCLKCAYPCLSAADSFIFSLTKRFFSVLNRNQANFLYHVNFARKQSFTSLWYVACVLSQGWPTKKARWQIQNGVRQEQWDEEKLNNKAGDTTGTEWNLLKRQVCRASFLLPTHSSDECLMNSTRESSLMSPCSRCRHN